MNIKVPTLTLCLMAPVLALSLACSAGKDEGSAGVETLSKSVYLPSEFHAYNNNVAFAQVLDDEGMGMSSIKNPHFKIQKKGSAEETEINAHEIGNSGIYAIGTSGKLSEYQLNLTAHGEHQVYFRMKRHGLEEETEFEIDVEVGHLDVKSSGNDYKVNYWLENSSDQEAPEEVRENENNVDIVFQILDDESGSAITNLTPLIYVAVRGGAEAITGSSFSPTSSTDGKYTYSGFTWSEGGEWDITLDVDGNTATHADRVTFTHFIQHAHTD